MNLCWWIECSIRVTQCELTALIGCFKCSNHDETCGAKYQLAIIFSELVLLPILTIYGHDVLSMPDLSWLGDQ